MRRLLALLCAAAGVIGCGVGAGESEGPRDVEVVVSRDFGAKRIDTARVASVPEDETVMRLLQRSFTVQTRYGGGFVESIEGLGAGRRVDWFYYVNGIEAAEGAAARKLAPGDRVWWDRHDWTAAMRVPAVVGSFPEPFASGTQGKRYPITIVCAAEPRSCDEVAKRLEAEGVEEATRVGIGAGFGQKVLRIVVGPWDAVRRDPAAKQLEQGPAASGVYARPRDGSLELLDSGGGVVRTLGAGSGLVAATRFEDQQPTWLVTGTDHTGVAAAAGALQASVLEDHFAVAVDAGRPVPLPTGFQAP